MEKNPESNSSEEIEKTKEFANDFINISLPLVIQNISVENCGTAKLRQVIEGIIHSNSFTGFEQFFSVLLFTDLRLPGIKNTITSYIRQEEDSSILKLIFFKLLYYWQFRYFSPQLDDFLINTLSELEYELNHKGYKSNITKGYIKGMITNRLKKIERF